jgi:DNA polymerase I-like protein with 3'-5' exonuclease and polymerase domains
MLTDRKKIASIERESKNTPIQGTGADCTKEALIRCRKYIQKTGAPVKIFMTVHDQIDTLCHRDYLETWKKDFIQIMERAALTIIPSGNLKADLTISDAWAK